MQTIRLGGVPEHFNLPIHLAMENRWFEEAGLNVEWTIFTGGTGQMTAALRHHEVDACILLTEGIIKDIIDGNPSKIVSGYINTPLIWGIHTGTNNLITHHEEVYDKQYAISRFGSGSHLMAVVDANMNNKSIRKDQFTIINHLEGALESLSTLKTDVFYWEKYTTKPYVDNGLLRRIGEFVTPWSCFMIAATDIILENAPSAISKMLGIIHKSCADFMASGEAIPQVARRYKQDISDVERWYHGTEWATHGWVSNKMLESVVHNLKTAKLIDENQPFPELVWRKPIL